VTVAFDVNGKRIARPDVQDSTFKLEYKYRGFPNMVANSLVATQFDGAPADAHGHCVVEFRFVGMPRGSANPLEVQ
jgi:hypothetical protein